MNHAELLKRVLEGRTILAGEYRGGRADLFRYVDTKSGKVMSFVKITYVVECFARGGFDTAKIMQRMPEAVTEPSQVVIGLEKGRKYAFELDSLSRERGLLIGSLGSGEPQVID